MATDEYLIKFLVIAAVSITAALLVLLQGKALTRADKYIGILLLLMFVTECVSCLLAYRNANNYPMYHIYSPVELALICAYFTEFIPSLKKNHGGLILGISGFVVAAANVTFVQPIDTFNSYFLIFETAVIVCLCLYSFYHFLLHNDDLMTHYCSFWVVVCILLYWSMTFAGDGLYAVISVKEAESVKSIINNIKYSVNVLFYLSISAVFIFYRRLIPSGGK